MAVNKTQLNDRLEEEIAGLDALDALREESAPRTLPRIWAAVWPKLAGLTMVLLFWQAVVWTHWKPSYLLPGPVDAFKEMGSMISSGRLQDAFYTTMYRAVLGFGLAVVIGTLLGVVMYKSTFLRSAFGSIIAGMQSMPSIAWFPLSIILFGTTELTILFVVVLGAFPSATNGLLAGVDHIPPLLLRAGRVLGAKGLSSFRHVVLPAALPGYVAGLQQGWAFSWRSLMAGELIVTIAGKTAIGTELHFAQDLLDTPRVLAMMVVILFIGILVDAVFFGTIERGLRRRRGLIDVAASS
jgi:NitT/TauT family transport system permease protein